MPSYRCTPEAGGAEFDCSQKQYDDMVAKDKLYAEAEAVYRKFFEEDVRIFRAGGVDEPTRSPAGDDDGCIPRRTRWPATETLHSRTREALVGEVRSSRSPGAKPGVSKEGSAVALRVCVDATRPRRFSGHGKGLGHGLLIQDVIYFGRFDGALKIHGS